MDNSRWIRFERSAVLVMMLATVCLSATSLYLALSQRRVSAAVMAKVSQGPPARPGERQLSPGDKLALLQESGLGGTAATVLFLSSTCRFCEQNAEFYRRLSTATKRGKINLVAVFSTRDTGAARFVAEHGIRLDKLLQLDAAPVSRVPTTVTVSADGAVEQVWRGVLQGPQQAELLKKFSSVNP